MASEAVLDRIDAGQRALDAGEWDRARELFRAALDDEDVPEAWEGLGWAGWWLNLGEATIAAREAAYRLYRARDDRVGAGRVAAWLAADHREYRGDEAVGNGWLGRSRRLLDGLPECPEHGWLALTEGSFALARGDAEEAAARGRAACSIGRGQGVPDLEGVGLAQEGVARVVLGDVEAGMRLLDEASAIVHGEDLHVPVSLAWALCYMIAACEGVGDFPRAAQWCEAMRELGERWHGRQILGTCRTAYGSILATRGDWPGADAELTGAVADFTASAPGLSAQSLVRLGELRVLQGRVDEARELFARAGSHADAIVALGELALEEGDALVARESAERVLRRVPDRSVLDRLPALELRARALGALGALDDAAAACAEVREIAQRLGTPYLCGRAHRISAEVAAARGDCETARREAEDAVDCFVEADAPHDAAGARLRLASALAALGRGGHAEAEARAAREAFARLGAVRDTARADELLSRLGSDGDGADGTDGPGGGRDALGELTARELDVLRLVALGMSDAEIARELVVSPHTVHRHVANIRTKLRLPSRAAAVAYASRAGLI